MRKHTLFLSTWFLAVITLAWGAAALAGPHGGGSLDAIGGPDGGAYAFVDNVAPDTTTFAWIELRGEPGVTWVSSWTNYDAGYSPLVPIGFPFVLYGLRRDSLRLTTNGVILFTDSLASNYNFTLPQSAFPGPAIVPYWDDLHLQRFGSNGNDRIGYKCFGDYTVIEYDSIAPAAAACVTQALKFEVLLFADGRIKFQYHTVNTSGDCRGTQTIGIQAHGAAGSPALRYALDYIGGRQPFSGLAIWFYPTALRTHDMALEALTAPATGYHDPGGSRSVALRIANLSVTAESAPVAYRFNGGAVVSESTPVLTPGIITPYTFATPLILPAVNGAYPLLVWSDVAGDEARANDTVRVTITVFGGASCASAIELTTAGPDSASWNNLGAGNANVGLPCSGYAYNDMVFKKTVAPGHTVTFWISSLPGWAGPFFCCAMRWGGSCPGTNLVGCLANQSSPGPDGYNHRFEWTNQTGATQTAYFTIASYRYYDVNSGDFTLAWQDLYIPHDFGVTAITSPPATPYAPGQVLTVPVRATVKNWSAATESALVKYRFNGGTTVSETTAALTQFATEAHTFATPFTLPMVRGTYPLKVWAEVANDVDHGNDTLTLNVEVFDGAACATAYALTTAGPDSATFSTCTGGAATPAQPCGASYQNRVFSRVLAPGHTMTLWQSSNNFDSRHTLRWGGSCPGTTLVDCADNPDEKRLTWRNSTGLAQTVYLTVGGASSTAPCGDLKLCWRDQVCAEDLCATTLGEGFENIAYVPTLPDCWTAENVGNDAAAWETYSGSPHGGVRCVSILNSGGSNNDWLFTPALGMQDFRRYTVEYYRRAASASFPATLEIKAGIAPTATAMTVTVTAVEVIASTVYQYAYPDFQPPASGVYYIGFHDLSGANARLLLDDIQVSPWLDCLAPTVTANAAVGNDSARLTVSTDGGSAGCGADPWSYRYQWYTGASCATGSVPPGMPIPGATQAVYWARASGVYYCAAWRGEGPQDVCTGCDSALATVIDCSTPQYPRYENPPDSFEDLVAPALPLCWSQHDANADGNVWQSVNDGSLAHSGAHCLSLPSSAGTPANDWLFSRGMFLEVLTGYVLEYQYRMRETGVTETLEVRLGLAPNPAAMTMLVDSGFSFNNTAYAPRHVVTSENLLNDRTVYYLGWHVTGGAGHGGVLIDDIKLVPTDCCQSGTDGWVLTVENASGVDSVVLHAQLSGGIGEYDCCPHIFRWVRGPGCDEEGEVLGHGADLLVRESGNYSCEVSILYGQDWPVSCGSAHAEVIACPQASELVITAADEGGVTLQFTAPEAGDYQIYSTSERNNDGDPRLADPQWTLETTLTVTAAGAAAWTDTTAAPTYKNYVVVNSCPPAGAAR